mgnify:CR=1 FL=1
MKIASTNNLTTCFFVTDLHGSIERYEKLFREIRSRLPKIVFIGGDVLPNFALYRDVPGHPHQNFLGDYLIKKLGALKSDLKKDYPAIFIIPGNDDPKIHEEDFIKGERAKIWTYFHNRTKHHEKFHLFGYACVPPTPFQLKDWERYDVSRYVDPGCISPEDGLHTVEFDETGLRYGTIEKDLKKLVRNIQDFTATVFLFHSPPYSTNLDRAALDGKMIDHVPMDVHVGSIAIRRFIEKYQPLVTLHGHIHESARITGKWQDRIGRTLCFTAAHDSTELALVRFSLEIPEKATRELL